MPLSRESSEFWRQQRNQFDRYAKRPLRHFEKYARWYAGDFAEIPIQVNRRGDGASGETDELTLANLTSLATRTFRGDLYCRNPRFLSSPPAGFNRHIFTPALARIETALLNDAASEVHLYSAMQKCILDYILAPYMVGRIGLGFNLVNDQELLEKGRLQAQLEDQRFALLEVPPRVNDTEDYHPAHIEQHERTLADWQRKQNVPASAMRYMQKHIEKHWQAMKWCRVGEVRRNQSVQFRRVNPLCYSFDIFNDEPGQRTWTGESFLMRIEDAENNPDYSPKAVKELSPIKQMYRQGDDAPMVRGQFDVTSGPDPMFRAFEYIDNVTKNVVLIAENGSLPLLVSPWGHSDILPGGPFIEASLLEHPLHNYGISSPHIYAKHQLLASSIAEINSEAVLRSLPVQYADMRMIGNEELAEVKRQLIGGIVALKNVRDGQHAKDAIGTIAPVEVPAQNVGMEAFHQAMIEKNNGGPARMGGGDRSQTATASEVVSAANQILTDDAQAKMDEFLRQLGVGWIRLMRKYYEPAKVAEIFGEEALLPGGWPKSFATRDILQDRNVGIVPGSTRRQNSDVAAKILQQQIQVQLPLVEMGLIPPNFILELVRRSNEALGVFALDYDGAEQFGMEEQLKRALAGMPPGQEGGVSPPESGPGAGGQRTSEMTEPSAAGQAQGLANIGGGRAGPGATRADLRKQRQSREAQVA